tara:strand:+ start:30392 stop:31453 length:1062 start_codon:yes stop_codon:yes gene_type:complete
MNINYLNKNFWKGKNILITGINGFIGGNLAKQLVNHGANIIGISNTQVKNKFLEYEGVLPKIKLYKVNIVNQKKLEDIIKKNNIQICFHLAAQVDVNISKIDPHETFETNIRGTYNLLESLRNSKTIKAIIVASSDKAYGEYPLNKLPYKEHYDLRPIYPYDVSKAAADMISKAYSTDLFKLPVIITRFANIYGPGQLNFTALIPDCILALLKFRKFIPRSNGRNKRDFLYVKDVCDLYMCLSFNLYKNKRFSGEIFNAGTKTGYTVDSIIKKLCYKTDNKTLYNDIKKRFLNKKTTGEIQHQFMTYFKINKFFGWKPKYKLEQGLLETYNWYANFCNKNDYKKFINEKLTNK